MLRINDLSRIAVQYDITKESKKRIELNQEAVSQGEALNKMHPKNKDVKLLMVHAYTNLAKSYRWNKDLRIMSLPAVENGMKALETLDPATLPKYYTVESLTLDLLNLKVAVISLDKDYNKALKVSTDLLEKTKPMLEKKTPVHHLTDLFGSLYHHAFLYEKLDDSNKAQKHLQVLLNTIDQCLKKEPNNARLLSSKKHYSKYKGRALK